MKTLQISNFGPPPTSSSSPRWSRTSPAPGQLAVAIEAALINPSDLTLIKGVYGVRPKVPAAVGP